jgi:small-conductance mechanosensitive channel
VRRFVGDLETWKSALGREGWLILQNLGIGLIGVVIALAAILVGGALWRVAAERYVQDTYRRRLLLIARKVVVGTAMALVLVFHFASELTTLITGLGFAAAGIAFALQTVILALAGYFSMVAPNGIRVGDRVSLQGPFGYVQGEVLDIGLVRIRLRELEGEPLRPTGRIVVFPNSVVFTGSFFKHPPSGDRGEGPRPVERSAAA